MGGNEEVVLHNAMKWLLQTFPASFYIPEMKKYRKTFEKIFEKGKKICFFSKNIMPDINQLSVEDCREKIREIFFFKTLFKQKDWKN